MISTTPYRKSARLGAPQIPGSDLSRARQGELDCSPVTVIDSYLVLPGEQKSLTRLLITGARRTLAGLPGFVFAKVHRSLDGFRVTTYSQWQSREDYETAIGLEQVREFLTQAKAAARSIDPRFYETSGIITPKDCESSGADDTHD